MNRELGLCVMLSVCFKDMELRSRVAYPPWIAAALCQMEHSRLTRVTLLTRVSVNRVSLGRHIYLLVCTTRPVCLRRSRPVSVKKRKKKKKDVLGQTELRASEVSGSLLIASACFLSAPASECPRCRGVVVCVGVLCCGVV